jgi:hypothetical protein
MRTYLRSQAKAEATVSDVVTGERWTLTVWLLGPTMAVALGRIIDRMAGGHTPPALFVASATPSS